LFVCLFCLFVCLFVCLLACCYGYSGSQSVDASEKC
jgi:hypothetical protein